MISKDSLYYPVELPDAPYIKPEERLLEGEFSIDQLYHFFNVFYDLAPTGSIPERVLTFVLQDFIFLDNEDILSTKVPAMWRKLDPIKVGYVLNDIFGDPEFVDWRDFLIYNMCIPFPTEQQVLKAWLTYNLFDDKQNETVIRKYFDYVKLWFEPNDFGEEEPVVKDSFSSELISSEENSGNSSHMGVEKVRSEQDLRMKALKELLFRMFQVEDGVCNYSGLLLAFCKDINPVVGLAKALSLSLRGLIGWDPCDGEDVEKMELWNFEEKSDASSSSLSAYNCQCGDTTFQDLGRLSCSTIGESSKNASIVRLINFHGGEEYTRNNEMKGESDVSFDSLALVHTFSDPELAMFRDRIYVIPMEAIVTTIGAALPWQIRTQAISNHSLQELVDRIYSSLHQDHLKGRTVYAFKFLQHPIIQDLLRSTFKFKELYIPSIVRKYL